MRLVTLLATTIAAAPVQPATGDQVENEGGQVAPSPSRPRSIYQLSPWVDAAMIGGASLAVVLPYAYTAKLITPRCPCDPAEVNAFDRGAIGNHSDFADSLSTATVAAVIAGSIIYELLELGVSEPFAEDMVVLAEALAVNGALVTFAKYTVQRPIPRVYAEPPGTAADYRSFYSGHTSTVFAALSVEAQTISARHGGAPWLWSAVVVIGGSVAVERVLAGYHFPTDVLVGAAMGTATGLAVSWLHTRKQPVLSGLILAPRSDGLMIGWAGHF